MAHFEPSKVLASRPKQRQVNITQLYENTCAKCHGSGAEGGGAGTPSLNTRDKFDEKWDKPFFNSIKGGVEISGMDAYGDTMSDEVVWALVVHIRELQAKALRSEFGNPQAANGVYTSQRHKFKIVEVIGEGRGLKTPWSCDWLPSGEMLVTNRPGWMMLQDKSGHLQRIEGVPKTIELGQGGFMDVAIHPRYTQNHWIYLSFSEPARDGSPKAMTKVVRGELQRKSGKLQWINQKTIFEIDQKQFTNSTIHFGSKFVFDRANRIYFSMGERGNGNLAQDLTRPNGKIYRLNDDGTVPSDNPFADAASRAKGYLPQIWSYGHRNPQGLAIDLNGNLWDTEHAPRGGDELNLIKPGRNYGWPNICFGINYNDSAYRTPWPNPSQNYVMPVHRWIPSIAPCGLSCVPGKSFKGWRGDLLAGGLAGKTVERIRVKDGKMIEHEELIHDLGRVRDVREGPDGAVYVTLNEPDKVIKLVRVGS